MMATSILIAIVMIVLANVSFSTTPVETGPGQFRWYTMTFSPDWRLVAGDVVLFLVGLLCVVIPKRSTPG